ncbi:agmatine deiminase family protein [Streptomyces indicus]|uniref:Agmatine deiminase n=1 Tax=Streptomyces indicus TaxID=417292 RepID=A0A1G8TE14_9ACTN|nr:agmatine deiminase family protein [Streptomyces indicus]SDJ39819.1 agmatine deiminase [Streptomyces indicus]
MSRRQTLQAALGAAAAGILAACRPERGAAAPAPSGSPSGGGWRMPEEAQPHELTYMAWPTRRIWGADLPYVHEDIASVARAVADFEPVVMLAGERDVKAAQRACGSGVEVVPVPVDDLWVRDTGPTFVLGPQGIAGIDLNFNGWGGKQTHRNDSEVARKVLGLEKIERIGAPVVGEGGSIEIDGAGTLLATESSWVNDNRNPGRSRDDIEQDLRALLGVTKVIWVDGVKGHDITDYHIDALARFVEPGLVVLSTPPADAPRDVWWRAYEQARGVLEQATDARGKRLEIVRLPEAAAVGDVGADFLGSYVNYYVCNGAVIFPGLGDRRTDRDGRALVRELYPDREVVQVPIRHVAAGGGGVHCATQQLPKLPRGGA